MLGKRKHKRRTERSVKPANVTPLTREQIALCAYHIWQVEGHPEGRAVEHWLQAEVQLSADRLEMIKGLTSATESVRPSDARLQSPTAQRSSRR
jgi:hypothetical protein